LAAGQFCTCPNLFVLIDDPQGQQVIDGVKEKFEQQEPGVLFSDAVLNGLSSTAALLQEKGAELLAGGKPSDEAGIRFQNTLFKITGDQFLANAEALQTEGFGPLSLGVMAKDLDQFYEIAENIEGSLTGSIYGPASDPAASGHPGFSAVGLPGSIVRFTKLDCYDNMEDALKPDCLK